MQGTDIETEEILQIETSVFIRTLMILLILFKEIKVVPSETTPQHVFHTLHHLSKLQADVLKEN